MDVWQIGNFGPPYSTENDLKHALEEIGCAVVAWQENDPATFTRLADPATWRGARPDFVLWTRTGWDWRQAGWSKAEADARQLRFLLEARSAGVPVVGYHLDRWWGLARQHQVLEEPFFRADHVITADGHGPHGAEFSNAGVHHGWLPPAVSSRWVGVGTPRPELTSPIAFVGSWREYHPEWGHRFQLVQHLADRWGDKVAFWPKIGEEAIRGLRLQDLYASTRVVIGDSCLAPDVHGGPMTNYCSDRIPETLGRGGFLLHPQVPGITSPHDGRQEFEDCPALCTWELNHWSDLDVLIGEALDMTDAERTARIDQTVTAIREHHTYTERMRWVIAYVDAGAW